MFDRHGDSSAAARLDFSRARSDCRWGRSVLAGVLMAVGGVGAVAAQAPASASASASVSVSVSVSADPAPAAVSAVTDYRPLRPPLTNWLRTAGLAPEQAGAVILPLVAGAAVFDHNGMRAFNPASTMKLVTSYAALSLLGPDYRWHTSAYLRGRLQGDVLVGDLVLRGGGDPKLVVEDLAEFAARMRRAGLRELRGDLIIDDSLFDVGDESVERFDGNPSQPYNVRPHALLMNFKASRVIVQPVADRAEVSLDPPLADVQIDNDIQIVRGPCRHGAQGLLVRDVPASGGGEAVRLRVSGPYSAGCGEQSVFTAVLSHREFIHAFFKSVWLAAGGVFTGQTRLQRGGANGKPWLEWVSPRTLGDVIRDINKFSNNVMTRNLLLQLGAESFPAGQSVRSANPELARQTVVRWLQSQGLGFPELVLENGAGLSREERIAPSSMAQLLRHAAAGPLADLLRFSMPQVGVDGTMRSRMVAEPIAGNAWMKTGSLNDVRTIAGYVDALSGRRYVVVLLINGPRAEAAGPVQDQLLRWIHANG